MNTQHFVADQRVRTLAGEASVWYQSIHPFQGNWEELQERFRTQFSLIGNTREHVFHAWRSFRFDENAETIDAMYRG